MSTDKLDNITTAEVKAYFGITNTDKDSIIDVVRPLVVDKIKEYCRHDFESKARTNEKPVIKIRQKNFYSVYLPVDASDITVVEDGTTLTEDSDYFVDLRTGRFERIRNQDDIFAEQGGAYWTTKHNAIVISYTGGEALTQDVVLVFYEMVGIYAQLKTKTYVDNEGIEAAVTLTALPDNLIKVLDNHRRVRL